MLHYSVLSLLGPMHLHSEYAEDEGVSVFYL